MKVKNCLIFAALARNYLFVKLSFYFSFVFFLLLFFTFLFSKADDRLLTNLQAKDTAFLEKEGEKVKKRYDLDAIFEQDSAIKTPNGLELILVERSTGIVSGMDQGNIKPLLAFIYQTDGLLYPMTKNIDGLRINGPFLLRSEKREYNSYYLLRVEAQKEWLNNIFDNPLIIAVVLVTISLPIIFFLAWHITRPLKDLRLAANAVARGTLQVNPEIEKNGVKEFRDVGRSINYMIASLQDLSMHQQRLLSDISHELKTPLARLQLAVAILKKKYGENSETTRIENEIQKMNTMVLDLLSLSRQQVNQHSSRSVFLVEEVWTTLLADAKFEIEASGLEFEVENLVPTDKAFYLNGNVGVLSSAIENIIRNAKKYAQSKIRVIISLENENENENERLIITIDDDGLGVPESELEQIFRPFYRVDEARDRHSGGTGLGLAIVANAAKQHKGTVKAMRSEMGGLRVELSLPLWFE